MCSLRDHLPKLQNSGTVVFGISVQDVASKRAFAEKNHLNFPLLADTEKKVAQSYGVLNSRGMADRVTFIIGPNGAITSIDRAMRFERGPGGILSSHGDALEMILSGKWKAELGKPVPSFTLKNYDGKPVTSTDAKSKATVLIFVSTQCLISNAYNSRMAKLAETYTDKGVRFLGINANNGEKPEQIAAHAHAHDLPFPILKDTDNVIADRFQAQCTPEVWITDARGVARYHGSIDDSENEAQVKNPYLTDAIEALLAGKEPPQAETRAFGCAIKRVNKRG